MEGANFLKKERKNAAPISSEVEISYWVCAVWIERSNNSSFVYGCAAQCEKPTGWKSDPEKLDLPSGGRLNWVQSTVSANEFSSIQKKLERLELDLTAIFGSSPTFCNIQMHHSFIHPFLGHTAARIKAFSTLPPLIEIAGANGADFEVVLNFLEQKLNLPFKGEYVTHLGNFETVELQPWLEAPPPFLIEAMEEKGERSQTGVLRLAIVRNAEFSQQHHLAHLICRSNDLGISEQIVKLEAGKDRVIVHSGDIPVHSFDFRLFDSSGGQLIHHETANYLVSIHTVTSIPSGPAVQIDDKLSSAAKSAKSISSDAIQSVRGRSSQRSHIEFTGQDGQRRFSTQARDMLATHIAESSDDRWFERSINGQVNVTLHFNKLLSGGQIRAATIVDPFFGEEALRCVLMRVESQDVEITVVTSWVDRDPDTGHYLVNGTDTLEKALEHVRPLLNPRLKLINIVDRKRQAFHDRYLLLDPYEGQPVVYLLSNSLSKMAGNWPFCMSKLADDVRPEVQRYIEGLTNGKDITGSTKPEITFQWTNSSAI